MDDLKSGSQKRLAGWFARQGVPEFRKWLGSDDVPTFPPVVLPEEKVLRFLAKAQNPDGSWGEGAAKVRVTSFALIAYYCQGVTPGSVEYFDRQVEQAMI